MLLLTSTSGTLQLLTNAAALIDVHTTWVDTSGVAITPGRQNTQISTAATTVVTPAPAASTQRNIKTVHVRNRDPALSGGVIVQLFDGTTTYPLYNATLKPGDMVEITDMGGIQQYFS
jgi:hypothetical protein